MTDRTSSALCMALGLLFLAAVWTVGRGAGSAAVPSSLCRAGPARLSAGIRAVRPTPSRRMDCRGDSRLRAGRPRGVGSGGGGHARQARVGGRGAAAHGRDGAGDTATASGSGDRASRVDSRDDRRLRGRDGVDHRAGGAAARQRRRDRPGRQSAVPRLLHRGLRLAYRPDLRADPVQPASRQSVSGAGTDSLLLGLLPGTGRDCPKQPGAAPERRAIPASQRADHRPAADVVDLSRRARRRPPSRRRPPPAPRWRSSRRASKGCTRCGSCGACTARSRSSAT